MSKQTKQQKAVDFGVYLKEQLKNPLIKKHYDEYGKQLEIAYQILQLRKKQRMSQKELAERMGTRQSNVARMEAGQQNFSVEMLQKIARSLKRDVEVRFVKQGVVKR